MLPYLVCICVSGCNLVILDVPCIKPTVRLSEPPTRQGTSVRVTYHDRPHPGRGPALRASMCVGCASGGDELRVYIARYQPISLKA